ncbi:MAG TPA: hypothetical protein VI933_03950 [archaeon]|nr:hypothetical protein [archaeon]
MRAIVERPVQNPAGELRYGFVDDKSLKVYETVPGPNNPLRKTPGYLVCGVADLSGGLTRRPVRTGAFKLDLNKHHSDTFAFEPDEFVSRTFYADRRRVTWQIEFLFRETSRAICLEDGSILVREDLVGNSEYLKTLDSLAKAYADVFGGKAMIPGINSPEIFRDNGYGVFSLRGVFGLEAPI